MAETRLLPMSRDTLNLQIAHLGCNLAKSDAGMDKWAKLLAVPRRRLPDAASRSSTTIGPPYCHHRPETGPKRVSAAGSLPRPRSQRGIRP